MRASCTFVVLMLMGLWVGLSPLSASTVIASGTASADSACASTPCDFNDALGSPTLNAVLSPPFDPVWGTLPGANWISYSNTVCPGCTPVNPTPPAPYTGGLYNPTVPNSYITFTQLFNIPSGMAAVGGTLQIYSDDSVTVLLNPGSPGAYTPPEFTESGCNGSVPTCNFNGAIPTITFASFGGALLQPGLNTLQFQVKNLGNNDVGMNGNGTGGVSSYGLAYVLTLTEVPTPEPGTIALVGAGLLLAIGYGRRLLQPGK